MILLIWFSSKVRKCLRSTASPLCSMKAPTNEECFEKMKAPTNKECFEKMKAPINKECFEKFVSRK